MKAETMTREEAARTLKDFGLDFHCRFAHYASRDEQRAALNVLREALRAEVVDRTALARLDRSKGADPAVCGLCRIGQGPECDAVLRKYLQGVAFSLEREIERRASLRRPLDVEGGIRRRIEGWQHRAEDDLVEISAPERGLVWAHCIALRFSPLWEPKKGNWDRDTEFMFEMNFEAGLFIWLSLNTVPRFHGRRIASSFVAIIEELAGEMGFKRFVVPGPNPGYWCGQFGYSLHPRHDMGSFLHEVYREC